MTYKFNQLISKLLVSMNTNKNILTNELFVKLIHKYLEYCDNYLQSGLPECIETRPTSKERLTNLMNRVNINSNEFWHKFDTMLNKNLITITTEKTFKSRKKSHHVKIH